MPLLEYKPALIHSIRGTRYCYEVTKKVKGPPGFAPETYTAAVCDIVVKFTDDNIYFQFYDSAPILTAEELKEMIKFSKKGFVESDFKHLEPKEEE